MPSSIRYRPMPETAEPAAGTIVARNYLPAARVLAESYLQHHQGAGFTILVVDAHDDELHAAAATVPPDVRLVGPRHLDIDPDEFARMAIAYTVTELCTSIKPWLLRLLLSDHETAIYLDPDIEVFDAFGADVGRLAAESGIVLTPHVLEPMPRDGLRPSEADIMASGVFNLGFIGVSRDADAFLIFWSERLRQDAISSIDEQLFTDQRWVDNVPAMFSHTVIRDPGFNVAYWNVYQRPLARRANGTLTSAGEPVRFMHYSGFRPERPWLASMHFTDRPRVLLSEHPLLAELFDAYRAKLINAGYATTLEDVPYRWDLLPGGSRVTPSMRRTFRYAWLDAERNGTPLPPSPFSADRPAEFLGWATSPADREQARAGLSRWAMGLWRSKPELRHAFPQPLGAHAHQFRNWCLSSGVAQGELHYSAVSATTPTRAVPVDQTVGVNVLGYLSAGLGVGEMGRLVHDAVVASGLPHATVVEKFTVSDRASNPLPEGATIGDPRFAVSVLCVNADMVHTTVGLHPEIADNRYLIGLWSWELTQFPPSMQAVFGLVNEVWTISEFTAAAIARYAPASVPVRVFPVPVRDPLRGSEPPVRHRDGQTRFLFAFDHFSVFERKNPTAVISAFQRAFGSRDDVRLVVKSINGDQHRSERERLLAAAAGDARIELVDGYLPADELRKLYQACDCYVSLHRSEGFGLTVAEAMAHGLPVIATDYSGTAELLTERTGWPIPYRLVPVGVGNPPYPPEARWAEPDIEAAAAAMREVADNPDEGRRRGVAARESMLATRSEATAADWARTMIEKAHRRWQDNPRRQSNTAPVAALNSAKEALRWRADPGMPSRIPMARTLRRAVLRVIDHYDHHQRQVLGALMDGVEGAVSPLTEVQGRLVSQVEQLDPQLATIRAELCGLVEDAERLGSALAVERAERAALAARLDALDRRLSS